MGHKKDTRDRANELTRLILNLLQASSKYDRIQDKLLKDLALSIKLKWSNHLPSLLGELHSPINKCKSSDQVHPNKRQQTEDANEKIAVLLEELKITRPIKEERINFKSCEIFEDFQGLLASDETFKKVLCLNMDIYSKVTSCRLLAFKLGNTLQGLYKSLYKDCLDSNKALAQLQKKIEVM